MVLIQIPCVGKLYSPDPSFVIRMAKHNQYFFMGLLFSFFCFQSNYPSHRDQQVAPIHLAAARGLIDACNVLALVGANLSALSNTHGTPLHICIKKHHVYIAKFLIENGADVHALNAEGTQKNLLYPFFYTCQKPPQLFVPLLSHLLTRLSPSKLLFPFNNQGTHIFC